MPGDGSRLAIVYSDKYFDRTYEYRHVTLPPELARLVPTHRCMTEIEWRSLGIQQGRGWIHFMDPDPHPNVVCFRRQLQNGN